MKMICIGRNYVKHINELNNERPDEPVVFIKPDSAVLPQQQDFYLPEFSKEIHYEVEVLVKIIKPGKYIEEKFANRYYEEVSLGIDFTARDLQTKLKKKGLPWEKAKAFDGSAVIGKWIPVSKLPDVNDLNFSLLKNGGFVQKSNTSFMIWKIDQLISHVSKYFTLKIGDVIFTGTPEGVGKVNSGDFLEGRINDTCIFTLNTK